jgi:hypothetical protein
MEIKVISDQLDFDFESRVGPINDGTFRCINPLSALVEKRAVRKGKNLKSKRRRRAGEEKKEEIRERVETARPVKLFHIPTQPSAVCTPEKNERRETWAMCSADSNSHRTHRHTYTTCALQMTSS